MFTTTKIALAALMIFGIFGVGSAALAMDHEDDTASLAQIEREAAEARNPTHTGRAGSYPNAYFMSPSEQDTRKRTHSH
jgi:hypothetical protein